MFQILKQGLLRMPLSSDTGEFLEIYRVTEILGHGIVLPPSI
jgi:hypothetical protein